ncbi:MAG: DsbA family protein [Alphaproteobacteria bacterium]|jgi:protein-disulfide isomerase|nr:DsbA family protein [Alphaproteobacteria bacterium]MBT5389111.1 DsbA family protein [Alphaproteobacteria bacterium]MBT5541046.1 DsbA family protein [Alphaproteobacteria bacterium]
MDTKNIISLSAAFLIGTAVTVVLLKSGVVSGTTSDAHVKELALQAIQENPKAIGESLQKLLTLQEDEAQEKATEALTGLQDDLTGDSTDPVIGNPNGDVTVVEFFDYRCGYCKRMTPVLFEVVKADRNVRVVLKDFPILGPNSELAAKAALAAKEQGKYKEMHNALMESKTNLDKTGILAIATTIKGLNVNKLKKDMDSAAIESKLKKNVELALSLNITGTPGFIVGDKVAPGAMSKEQLLELIDTTRKTQKKTS